MKIFLNYYEALEYAKEHKLIECEYGDLEDNISYCYWNKSGDRNKEHEIEAYYIFRAEGCGAKPEKETSQEIIQWAIGQDLYECEHEDIEWGDDDERGVCLNCGAECDWHWVKGVDDNYPDDIREIDEREILEWHNK